MSAKELEEVYQKHAVPVGDTNLDMKAWDDALLLASHKIGFPKS